MSEPSRHALIIEDEMLVGMSMQSVLAGLGFASFAFAGTASQAVEQGRIRRPDLVTADLGLLDGDGREAIGALTDRWGPLRIIYVTGQADELDGRGGAIVVAKPFTSADIAAAYAAVTEL